MSVCQFVFRKCKKLLFSKTPPFFLAETWPPPPLFQRVLKKRLQDEDHLGDEIQLRLAYSLCCLVGFHLCHASGGVLIGRREIWFSATSRILVGGGNSNMFYFHLPNLGEDDFQFDIIYFSDGLVKNHRFPGVFFVCACCCFYLCFCFSFKNTKEGNPDECRDGKKTLLGGRFEWFAWLDFRSRGNGLDKSIVWPWQIPL